MVEQSNTEGSLDLAARRGRGSFTECQRLVCKLYRLVNGTSTYSQRDPVQGVCLSRDDNGSWSGRNPGHWTGKYGVNLEGNATGCGRRGHRNNLVAGDHSWKGPNGRGRWCGPDLSKGVRGLDSIGRQSRHQKHGPPDYWYCDAPNFHAMPQQQISRRRNRRRLLPGFL